MSDINISAVENFLSARCTDKLAIFDKDAEKSLKRTKESKIDDFEELKEKISRDRAELESKYVPSTWIEGAARRARQIQTATHILKFTNADARGTSIYSSGVDSFPKGAVTNGFISTAVLKSPEVDAVGNAAALDVIAFLQVRHGEKTLMELVKEGDMSVFAPFAENDVQLSEWRDGFMQVLGDRDVASHTLSKQIYFPVADSAYHLLSPLFASSLAHSIFGKIQDAIFGEKYKEVRKAKREGKYHDGIIIDYPNIARQNFGGSNPQNISQLNSKRRGAAFLLSCSPPNWKTRMRLPLSADTVFSRYCFGARVIKEIRDLRRFVERYHKASSNKEIRDERSEIIDKIVDELMNYAAEIQTAREMAEWTLRPNCKLRREEQLWLDPIRSMGDPEFGAEREEGSWQAEVADSFGEWICAIVTSKKVALGDVERRELKGLVYERLSKIDNDLEVFN